MNKLLLIAAACASLGLSACGARQQPTDNAPIDNTPTLPERCEHDACINQGVTAFEVDGIRVIVKNIAHPPLLTANIYVEGGAAFWDEDTAGHEGLALYAATDGGPEGTEREQYLAALESVGAHLTAASDRDYATISLFTPADAVDDTFALMARALQTPAFEDQHLANAQAAWISSVQSRWDSADNAVRELVQQLAWENHPYAVHPQGSEESLANITPDGLRQTLQRLLTRERMIVVFVGQIDEEHARALVHEHFAGLPSDPDWREAVNFPDVIAPLHYDAPRVRYLDRAELPTNYILGYFAAPSLSDEDYPALLLATQLLRHRLFEEVRTRRNLTYAVYSALGARRSNIGVLYVTTTNPGATVPVMLQTVDGMLAEGSVTQADIDNQVRTWLTEYFMDLQSFDDQAALLARWEMLGGSRVNADTFVDHLRALTPEDITRVLDRYIRDIQFAVVGNPSQAEESLFLTR